MTSVSYGRATGPDGLEHLVDDHSGQAEFVGQVGSLCGEVPQSELDPMVAAAAVCPACSRIALAREHGPRPLSFGGRHAA